VRYGKVAQSLHWLVFLLMIASFGLGLTMVGMEVSPQRIRMVGWHKTVGVTILVLAFLRLAWRFVSPPPALPATMPAWERAAAHASHWLLYALMLAVPVSGWLMSSALGFSTVYLGIAKLPDLLTRDRELGETLKLVHFWLNKGLLAMIVLHAAAALKHHFWDKDDVLRRMSPFVFVLVLPWNAFAQQVDLKRSKITFVYKLEQKVLVEGAFPKWRAQVALDEKNLAKASVRMEIDLLATDTGNADSDKEVQRPRWFDTAKYAQATYVSDSVRKAASGYEAVGRVTLKGKTRDLTVPFTYNGQIAQGKFVIKRLEFGVGDGQWADVTQVSDEVEVRFTIAFNQEKK
jgi:cytochrome b561